MKPQRDQLAVPASPRASRWRRWLVRLSICLSALLGLVVLGYFGASWFLTQETSATTADLIVVLGGESPRRSARCAELFHAGAASRILVTGGGDAAIIRRYLIQAGVPSSAITLESESVSTWENARFSAPLLDKLQVKRAFLVTSWFHTRRALATFRRASPNVEFFPVPCAYSWAAYTTPSWERFKGVYREYGKILGYLFLYGVWPLGGAR